jgi:hypothetical protein
MDGPTSHTDTYLVIPHAQLLLGVLVLTVIGVLIWMAIARLTPGTFRAARTIAIVSWIAGILAIVAQPVAMMILPAEQILGWPGLLTALGMAALAGAALTSLAGAVTLAALLISLSRRITRR